jgi:hypothetical protein
MLPAAIAIAMVGFIGAFGAGSVPSAQAVDGDICAINTSMVSSDGAVGDPAVDYVTLPGLQEGLVFRVEDTGAFDVPNVEVRIDSETGSARITSKAEITDVVNPDGPAIEEQHVDHVLVIPSVLTQVVDTIDPDSDPDEPGYFTDPDGNDVDGISGWLEEVAGFINVPSDDIDDPTHPDCGDDDDTVGEDAWGFIDFECIEAGTFHIDILTPDDTEETGMTIKVLCIGQADSASIKTQRTTLETHPTGVAPSGFAESIITVTVEDQFGDRLDGVEVTLTTDNCTFARDPNTLFGDAPSFISPAGGGKTVTIHTDTDFDEPASGNQATDDEEFLADNPLETFAGTAEAILDCGTPGPTGTPGVANITAVVQREGSDIVLTDLTGDDAIKVVGQTSASGLTLVLDPDEVECGEVIKATAKALDSTGAPVSPGTEVLFTTDTSSGIVGGSEGAQGGLTTVSGEVSVLIATDPGNPGIHTVIAYVINAAGTPSAQASATYECEGAVAPAAPTVAPPATGTGTITPPSTGDAGLATGSTSATLFVIAGAVAFILAGLASVRFARN